MGDPLQIQIPQRSSVQTSSQLNTHIQKLLSQVAYQQDSESDDNNEQQLQSPVLNAKKRRKKKKKKVNIFTVIF